MKSVTVEPATVVFGAFDRHNFGDLLFAHVAAALLKQRSPVFAGLADADLRPLGGHRVSALRHLPVQFPDRRIDIFHAGGELLTCTAWQAAVMLLPAAEVQPLLASLAGQPHAQRNWARSRLGVPDLAPYTISPASLPRPGRIVYAGVGGVGLGECDPAMRAEVLDKLRAADAVGVREHHTRALLAAAGIASRLMPDPAALTAALFSRKIRRHAQIGSAAAARKAFPDGYLAVQFSADFGDDATLASLAAGLDQAALAHGCGVVVFRAGAAPWHDDLDCYRRTAARMRTPALVAHSLNLWSICALIAGSSAYLGSSLHGRIIAMAYALPRLNLQPPGEPGTDSKQAAYAATWESADMPGVAPVADAAAALASAMRSNVQVRRSLADALAAACRDELLVLASVPGNRVPGKLEGSRFGSGDAASMPEQ
jgi:hypothetical protein